MKKANHMLAAALALALMVFMPGYGALAHTADDAVTDIDLAAEQGAPGVVVSSIIETHPDVARNMPLPPTLSIPSPKTECTVFRASWKTGRSA